MSKKIEIEKLVIDHEAFHRAYDKIVYYSDNPEMNLTLEEDVAFFEVIDHIIGVVVPSKEQIELQIANVKRLDEIDFDKNKFEWWKTANKINFFESRWC